MTRQRVAVMVTGNDIPKTGRRWSGYRTAVNELVLGRSQGQRHTDRQKLKAGGILNINGYVIQKCT